MAQRKYLRRQRRYSRSKLLEVEWEGANDVFTIQTPEERIFIVRKPEACVITLANVFLQEGDNPFLIIPEHLKYFDAPDLLIRLMIYLKMKNKFLLLFVLFLFCIGCYQDDNSYKRVIDNSKSYDFGLVQESVLHFPLDSISTFDIKSLQIVKNDSSKYFVYFNSKKNVVYFYEFDSQKLSFNIELAEEGVNGVGFNVIGIYAHSLDSIYIFSDYAISRVNTEGKVSQRITFDGIGSLEFGFTLEAGTKQNIYKFGNELYVGISSELDPFLPATFRIDNQVLLKVDLETLSKTTHFDFPDIYRENIYSPNYSNIYFTFNEDKNLFIVSFPADYKLYLNSFNNYPMIVDAGSKYFNQIDPLIEDDMREDFITYTKHYLTNFSFGPIYFDKYRDIYYRFVEHPITEIDFDNKDWFKTCSIILIDKGFNIIGESRFDNDVNKAGIVDESGLLIPMKCPDDSEEFLCIGVYSVVENFD